MSITSFDIKFRQSERMTDDDDGGGLMSAVEVVDGQTNNVFSDRSDLDGILGRVSLRKIFLDVDTPTTDTLLGAFVFLTEPPQDPHVSVCIFNTGAGISTDERAAARSYVEAYRNEETKSQFTLYGRHLVGQQTIQVYCRQEIASPDIGDVLCLSVEKEGFQPNKQFVKVQQVASRQTITFTDEGGDFIRDVLIILTTSALQFEFIGQEDPVRFTGQDPPPTIIRFTRVVNSARYYGQKICTEPPEIGDLVIDIGDPYIPIVPTSQAETPLVDLLAGLGAVSLIESGAAAALSLGFTATAGAGAVITRYLGSPYARGSLSITIGAVGLTDDGNGNITASNPANTGWDGSADYLTGSFSITRDVGFSGSVAVTATPAGAIPSQAYSRSIKVTAATRQLSYVFQLPGQPSPGTVILDYLALGKWIRLSDNGTGQLAGASGQGAGTVNYATGSVAVTLGALPDVDSALIVAWGTDLRARDSSGEVTIPTPTYRIQLNHPGVVPDSFSMTWVSGAVTKTATADAGGSVTGAATGAIDCTAGVVEFSTSFGLDSGNQFQCSYDYADPSKTHLETFTPAPAGHAISITLAHAPVLEHTVVAEWTLTVPQGSLVSGPRVVPYAVRDNGSGGFLGALTGTNSINYTTGAVVLTVDQ